MKYKDYEIRMPDAEEARAARQSYLDDVTNLICNLRDKAEKSQPFQYDPKEVAADWESWQRHYRQSFGKPLCDRDDSACHTDGTLADLYSDDMGEVKRAKIKITDGVCGEGLLFLPKNYSKDKKLPLIISLHGGSGTPELCSDTWGNSANYNAQTRRVLELGAVVYAPFLLVGSSPMMVQKINYCREAFEDSLEKHGWSMHALEITHIMNAIDFITGMEGIDGDNIGIIGLSWGSMYSVWTAAADKRIKAVYASCGQTNGTLASFIAPRRLVVEYGAKDELTEGIKPHAEQIEGIYREMGCEDNLRINCHGGGHELDGGDGCIHWAFDGLFGK